MFSIEGIIVNTEVTKRGRIEIDQASGLITKVSEASGEADVVLSEELIFPGFIDVHVHARECVDHSQDYKEDFKTAGLASINGGVVAIAEMPNNPVPPIDDESYEEKNKLTKKSDIDVLLYAGIGPETKPLNRKVPYKVFMGKSVGDLFFKSLEKFEEVIKTYEGQNVSFHCENPEMLEEKKDEPTHGKRRPPEAEISAIDFALDLIKKYNIKGKICHASTLAGIEKIIEAKKSGLPVTVEITPHHLFYDAGELDGKQKKFLQINPPVRDNHDDRLRLIQYLKNGDIDFVATDHAPHTVEEKEAGTSGVPHLDTFGLFATWLMKEHNFSPSEIARVCSENPGEFVNEFLPNKFGKIEEGYVGSLAVIDMNNGEKLMKENLKTKCGWSPFEGFEFPGKVSMTIIRGRRLK